MDESQIHADIEATYQQALAATQKQAIQAQVRLEHALRRIDELEAAQTATADGTHTEDAG